jgi:FMN-dependent NADH-azoreductase
MTVLGLMGSPRIRGNSDLLLDAALAGAVEGGAECRTVVLNRLSITACQHCEGCTRTQGQCVIEDEMQSLYEPLRTADRVILAAPAFFMSLPAQTKMLIDRCQPLWVIKYLVKKPVTLAEHERRGLYLGVGGCDFRTAFESARLILRAWFAILDVPQWDMLTYNPVETRGEIKRHPTALSEATEAGRKLAQE